MDINYYKPFLKTLEENTKNNNHIENCVLIAYNFGTNLQNKQAKEIDKEYEKFNDTHFESDIYFASLARDYLVKDILHNMDNKKLSKAIYKVL